MAKRKRRPRADDQDQAQRPTPSRIVTRKWDQATVFDVPTTTSGTAVVAIGIGLFGSAILSLVTWAAWTNRAQVETWGWPFLAVVWSALLGLLLYGCSLLARRGQVIVSPQSLTISESGLFFRRFGSWPADQIQRVGALPSAVTVNHQPVLELAVVTRADQRFGAFTQLTEDEVRWLATRIRQTLEIPTAETAVARGAPNARGYFVLTRFVDWRPGELIHLFSAGATPAALAAVGLLFGVLGAVVGGFGGLSLAKAHPAWSPWEVAAIAALLSGTLGAAFTAGAWTRRKVVCDWTSRTLLVEEGRSRKSWPLADITALVLSDVVASQTDDGSTRLEYIAQLDVRLAGQDAMLLTTDHWESAAASSRGQLRPLARRWAEALGVPLVEEGQRPFRREWARLVRNTPGWLILLLVLELAASGAWIAWRW